MHQLLRMNLCIFAFGENPYEMKGCCAPRPLFVHFSANDCLWLKLWKIGFLFFLAGDPHFFVIDCNLAPHLLLFFPAAVWIRIDSVGSFDFVKRLRRNKYPVHPEAKHAHRVGCLEFPGKSRNWSKMRKPQAPTYLFFMCRVWKHWTWGKKDYFLPSFFCCCNWFWLVF